MYLIILFVITTYPLWQQQTETFFDFLELHLNTFFGPESLFPMTERLPNVTNVVTDISIKALTNTTLPLHFTAGGVCLKLV